MNPPLPRGFYTLLLLFGLLVCILFAAATFFFPERSIERVSAYFTLTMGTCVLMCTTGLVLMHRWIERHFITNDTAPDTAPQSAPFSTMVSAASELAQPSEDSPSQSDS